MWLDKCKRKTQQCWRFIGDLSFLFMQILLITWAKILRTIIGEGGASYAVSNEKWGRGKFCCMRQQVANFNMSMQSATQAGNTPRVTVGLAPNMSTALQSGTCSMVPVMQCSIWKSYDTYLLVDCQAEICKIHRRLLKTQNSAQKVTSSRVKWPEMKKVRVYLHLRD